MIRNEAEYQEAVKRLSEEAERISRQKSRLQTMDLSKEEIKRV